MRFSEEEPDQYNSWPQCFFLLFDIGKLFFVILKIPKNLRRRTRAPSSYARTVGVRAPAGNDSKSIYS